MYVQYALYSDEVSYIVSICISAFICIAYVLSWCVYCNSSKHTLRLINLLSTYVYVVKRWVNKIDIKGEIMGAIIQNNHHKITPKNKPKNNPKNKPKNNLKNNPMNNR